MKKILLPLGAIIATTAPVVSVISCGTEQVRKFNILPTYTGQADQLIALGVKADYYPFQLNSTKPFSYLTNPGQFMVMQDGNFKRKFSEKVQKLMPKTKGPSWWNQDAKNSDDKHIDNTYWQKQQGNILMYEHYLLDDGQKIVEEAWAPRHAREASFQTNFRASRDPYTRIPKGVFFGWDLSNRTIQKIIDGRLVSKDDITEIGQDGLNDPMPAKKITNGVQFINNNKVKVILNGEEISVTPKEAKIIKNLRNIRKSFLKASTGKSSWFYNDWFFVDSYHRQFLDNNQFNKSNFKAWIIDSTKQSPFDNNTDVASKIKALFDASTFTEEEVKNEIPCKSTIYSNIKSHHPIYEQQGGKIGAAPMFEGATRDNQLYLFNIASQLSNLANWGTPYGKQHYNFLPNITNDSKEFRNDQIAHSKKEADIIKEWISKHVTSEQLGQIKRAYDNANIITKELKERMQNIKGYFKQLGLNGKTFGIFTIAPGHGVSTIQSMSKYSFIYNELGFGQPIPNNLDKLSKGASEYIAGWQNGNNRYLKEGSINTNNKYVNESLGPGAMFNMDDNGWFWNMSSEKKEKISANKLEKFKGQFDLGIITSIEGDWTTEIDKNEGIKTRIAELFKNYNHKNTKDIIDKAREDGDYNLWNEGLKTPFVMHMLLDIIIKKAEQYVINVLHKTIKQNSDYRKKAISWGNYFTTTFIK